MQSYLKDGEQSNSPYALMSIWGLGGSNWDEFEKELGADVARKIRLSVTDWRTMDLRQKLKAVKLSDEELDKLSLTVGEIDRRQYELQASWTKPGRDSQQSQTQYQALEEEKKSRIATFLGPDRYAEYEKQNDYRYTQLKSFAQYNRLTDEQLEHVYQVWVKCMNRHTELNNYIRSQMGQATPETLQQTQTDSAKAINAETIETLEAYLGPDMYQRFRRSSGW